MDTADGNCNAATELDDLDIAEGTPAEGKVKLGNKATDGVNTVALLLGAVVPL